MDDYEVRSFEKTLHRNLTLCNKNKKINVILFTTRMTLLLINSTPVAIDYKLSKKFYKSEIVVIHIRDIIYIYVN